ncbi:excisionase family DNA binding protein [Rhodoligotrophos appendicifer]|uniref:helix-turn-helix domain-containing protein n=1 Tax=Rhodoligotrophos appendicifer TaxID=987056 RepID=UPI0011872C9E|nr:helix-turn-helix domain-containing protein [Rhodoligotrophos appendicifer]
MNTATNALLNTEQAANVIGVTERTLSTWRHTGHVRIPYVKIGRKVVYRRSDLERYLDEHTVNASAAAE